MSEDKSPFEERQVSTGTSTSWPVKQIAEPVKQIAEPVESSAKAIEEPAESVAEVEPPPAESTAAPGPEIPPPRPSDRTAVLAESRQYTRRSFAVATAAAAAGYGFYHWLNKDAALGTVPPFLTNIIDVNAAISHGVFHDRALSPTYPLERAENLRINGVYGLKRALAPESWRLQLVGTQNDRQHPKYTPDVTAWQYRYTHDMTEEDKGHDTKVDPSNEAKVDPNAPVARGSEEAGESDTGLNEGTGGLLLTIPDITKLPRHELVTQFKCIEGWSQIVHWAGVRMADFMEAYPPAAIDGKPPKYAYMETPDGDYYTGYDLDVCRHPQTLLVTEMMGMPLTQFHGSPLRLHMPTKYGYKQIKRIGLISYTNDKPDDYWAKLGYDWYAGL